MQRFEKQDHTKAFILVLFAGIIYSFGAIVVRHMEAAASFQWQYLFYRGMTVATFLASGPKTLQEVTSNGILYGGHRLANGAWDLRMSEKSMMQKHLKTRKI